MDVLERAVEKVILSLNKGVRIGVAVSGGSDSVALLFVLAKLRQKLNFTLTVLTVDHGLRKESYDDALFVQETCSNLNLPCQAFFASPQEVEKIAATRHRGIEDAARFLRYSFFHRMATSLPLDVIFTAHTKNDLTESLLMQFLTGKEITGLKFRRGIFMRPFLSVGKKAIVEYLQRNCISFREDSSNGENRFLRNKIRNLIIPQLDATLPHWEKAILTAEEKIRFDRDAAGFLAKKCPVTFPLEGLALIGRNRFERLPMATKRRILLKVFSRLGANFRVSSKALNGICASVPRIHFKNVKIEKKNKIIYVFSQKTLEFFFNPVYIYSVGIVKNRYFSFELREDFSPGAIEIPEEFFPFTIRQAEENDKIQCADGKEKSVFKILKDWQIPLDLRRKILVLESNGKLFALLGKMFFAKNWIIKTDGRKKWLKIEKSPKKNKNLQTPHR